jgi:hypothetical protein
MATPPWQTTIHMVLISKIDFTILFHPKFIPLWVTGQEQVSRIEAILR